VCQPLVFKLEHKLYIVCQPPYSTKILGAPILTAMGLKIKTFWDVMLCRWVISNRRFEGS